MTKHSGASGLSMGGVVIAGLLALGAFPATASQQKVVQPDGWAGGWFAEAGVAISGEWAAVAQPYFSGSTPPWGSVYLYRKAYTSRWDLAQVLPWPDGGPYPPGFSADFGRGLAIDREYMVVGSPGAGSLFGGRAYVYRFREGQWRLIATLQAHDAESFDGFGAAVDIRVRNVEPVSIEILVGAPGDDDRGLTSGSAYLFRSQSGLVDPTFAETQKVTASDGAVDFRFGSSVAIAPTRDRFLVGAFYATGGNGAVTGAAYVFALVLNGWTETRKLVPPDGATYDRFGFAVDLGDDFAAVGAPLHRAQGLVNAGAVYVFDARAAGWPLDRKLEPGWGSTLGDLFGYDVALSGDRVLTGAQAHDVDGIEWVGSLNLFTKNRQTGAWDEQVFEPKVPTESLYFGYAVAISGERMITAAYGDDQQGEQAGAAYLLFPPFAPTQP